MKKNYKELKKEVLKENTSYKTLINNVCFELELNTRDNEDAFRIIYEITNYGVSGGLNGFIYYTETIKFFRKNKKSIQSLLENMAEYCGENVCTMIKGFSCISDEFTEIDIAKALYGNYKEKYITIYNGFAWFACEEVMRMFYELIEENK